MTNIKEMRREKAIAHTDRVSRRVYFDREKGRLAWYSVNKSVAGSGSSVWNGNGWRAKYP